MINVNIQSPNSIQNYLNQAKENGGDTVFLASGTYYPTSDIDIPSGVYLVGSERSGVIIDFGNQNFSLRSIGTVDEPNKDILIKNITVQNSSSYGIYLEYTDNSQLDGVDITNCLYGYYITDCSATGLIGQGGFMNNCGTGIKQVNCVGCSIYFTSVTNNTGNGLEVVNSGNTTIFDSGFDDNAGNGILMTGCSGMGIVSIESLGNGGVGIELTGGCYDIQFSATPVEDNVSDGFKFTDTVDSITLNSCAIKSNGGYGINIANANCDNNLICSNQFSGNTSGEINDSGTGTLIRSNIGVADN